MDFDDNYSSGGSDDETEEQVSEETIKKDYDMAGEIVGEEKDEISLFEYRHLLRDNVHCALQEVLSEVRLPFNLANFQKLSLHVMGSSQNLVLISPTGSVPIWCFHRDSTFDIDNGRKNIELFSTDGLDNYAWYSQA